MQNRLLFSALLTVMSLASSYCQAQGREVGEKVLVDVTGARKNWETATIRAKDAAGYKVEMLGVGKYVGEFYVPEAWFYDAASGSIPQAGVSYGTAGSGKVKEFAKVGDSVLVDVTGAKKNWETGKVIAKSGNMYRISGTRKLALRCTQGRKHGGNKLCIKQNQPWLCTAFSK